MSRTIFEKIIDGEINAEIVFENSDVIAFKDINPQAPVHVLVIPRKKASRMSDLKEWNADDAGNFFKAVSLVASELGLDQDGYRVVINNGTNGGQEVEYLHAHILAGRQMKWPPG